MIRGQAIRAVQQTELRRRRYRNRRWAHDQLVLWAEQRTQILEALGWPNMSIVKKAQMQQEGAHQRGAPPELTGPERAADRTKRVLTIERIVRDMPDDWRRVIAGYYIRGRTIRGHAEIAEIDRNTVCRLLHSAQECVHRMMANVETTAYREAREKEAESRAAIDFG